MGTLALAYEKGRYGLAQNYQRAQYWYRKLLQAFDSGQYPGNVDHQFITFQRARLEYVSKAPEERQSDKKSSGYSDTR